MWLGLRASLAAAALTLSACGSSFSSTGSDAGSDVSSAEAGVPDSPSEASGDGGSYCSSSAAKHATYCEDFDEYANLAQFLSAWPAYSSIGGTFSLDTTTALSAPNALRISTTTVSAVRSLAIQPMPTLPSPLTKQRLEFDLRITSASKIGGFAAAAVAAILFGNDVTGGAVALSFGSSLGSPTLQAAFIGPSPDGGTPAFGSMNAPPPFPTLNEWTGRFAIEIDYESASGDPPCAQLYIGPLSQLPGCGQPLPASLSHPGAASIALGVYSGGVGDTGDVGVVFDNVVYTAQ
jgi:hypothetical protein